MPFQQTSNVFKHVMFKNKFVKLNGNGFENRVFPDATSYLVV